jgi:hypothetical protein
VAEGVRAATSFRPLAEAEAQGLLATLARPVVSTLGERPRPFFHFLAL